jgi:hypothetical protein
LRFLHVDCGCERSALPERAEFDLDGVEWDRWDEGVVPVLSDEPERGLAALVTSSLRTSGSMIHANSTPASA